MAVAAVPGPSPVSLATVGRVDGYAKVSGGARYTADLSVPGMLYGDVVRSPHPHARIVAVHTEQAAALSGVRAVLTAADIPHGTFGRSICDVPALARDVVRFVGERVAAVAADTPELARVAAALIEVEYEPLPALLDPQQALAPDAPRVHETPWLYQNAAVTPADHPNLQSRTGWEHGGNVDAALAAAHRVFTHTFHCQLRHQGYLEPHACIVDATGAVLQVWAPHKSPYQLRSQLAAWVELPIERVLVHHLPIGGDFGGKGSLMDVPVCTVLSQRTGRPVRMRMRYTDELIAASPRHPASTAVRLGLDRQHRVTALDLDILIDGGAYGGFKPIPGVQLRGNNLAGMCYRIPAIRIASTIVSTHTVPRGHMRAPGSIQVHFAVESMMDLAARSLGLDPVEFRELNMIRDGDTGAMGEPWLEVRSEPTLAAALAALRESTPAPASAAPLSPAPPSAPAPAGRWAAGTGIAFYARRVDGGRTEVALAPQADGSLTALIPFPDQGAGQYTMARNTVLRHFNLPPALVQVQRPDLQQLGFDPGCSTSRVTVDGAEALTRACRTLRTRLQTEFRLSQQPTAAELQAALAAFHQATGGTWVKAQYVHAEIPLMSFCVQIARVQVDRATGQVQVAELITALDVADILNPLSHQVQAEGGIVTSYGDAVLEELLVEEGRITTANLGEYRLPSQRDLPPMRMVLVGGAQGAGEMNVKAIGQLSNIAVAAAVGNAVADAVGVRIDSMPITAEKVFAALHQTKEASP